MSGRALGWAFQTVPFLKDASEKLVLLKLAQRVKEGDDSGKCWPSIHLTAADVGISPRSVLRAQKNLEILGLVVVERRSNLSSNLFLQLNVWLVGDTVSPSR